MKKIENIELNEIEEFKKNIIDFFQGKNLDILFQQIYQKDDLNFENLEYLFQITNKNSLLKREKDKLQKYFSFSTNLLNALFYLNLRFIKELPLKKKLESDILKKQNNPVLLILDFKDKSSFKFKKGEEAFEILINFDFSSLKKKILIIDSVLKFDVFLNFLKEKNKNFDIKEIEYFKKDWRKIEEFNKKNYI